MSEELESKRDPGRALLCAATSRPGCAGELGAAMIDAAVGLVVVGADGLVRFANRRMEALAGVEGMAGRALGDCAPGWSAPRVGSEGEVIALAGPGWAGRGGILWTRSPGGGFVGVLPAPSRAAAAPEAADRDPSTGFATRRHLQTAFDAFRAQAPGVEIVALNVALDRFKRASEFLGAAGAEGLLRRVADRMRRTTRATDAVARIGDGEFAVLMPVDGSRDLALELAQRLIETLSRPFVVGGRQILIGASVGLAAASQGAGSAAELVGFATMALGRAREKRGGGMEWFTEAMAEEIRERQFIETSLRNALLLDQFEMHFQPQFGFRESRITGFEALIRWRHPVRGLISPGDFIPAAEETGFMPALGAWILRASCAAAAAWDPSLSVAVNVSPLQFEREDLVGVVSDALERSGLAPARLEIELTEAVLLDNSAATVARMEALRALGVRLALDDFGIGYSSLNYLRQFPFDKIKMDQSFVRGSGADEAAFRIVGAVVQLGESFGMSVLAEGVETPAQLETMWRRGVRDVQGYLFSKPIPGSRVAEYIDGFKAPEGWSAGADKERKA